MNIQEIHKALFEELLIQFERNPDLRVRTRKSNRGNKLREKGYWFLGNDYYLAIGFWKGMNWKTRTPNISFHVNTAGNSYLIISTTDSNQKDEFVRERIAPKIKLNKSSIYSKPYEGQSPVEALRTFLEHDWPVIEEEIKRISNGYKYRLDFGLISYAEFQRDVKNIEKFRKEFLNLKENEKPGVAFKLNRIFIEKYEQVENLELSDMPNNSQWIFLTGENGSGKTTILRAIAVGLLKNRDQGKIIDRKFELNLRVQKDDLPFSYRVNENTFQEDQDLVIDGFVAYGPSRLMSDSDPMEDEFIKINSGAIKEKIAHGLFYPIDVLQTLASPYDLGEKPKYLEMELDAFLENLNEIIPNTAVSHDEDLNLLFFDDWDEDFTEQNAKKFNELSSGTKSFCGLIIDLLLKFRKQQPDVNDPANYKGIVIIDEIDLHLHPQMQKEMVEQLGATFPDIQFIVSTHSPVPLLGAPKNSIFYKISRTLEDGIGAERLDIDVTTLNPNLILTSPIFGFSELLSSDLEGKLNTQDYWYEKKTDDSKLKALLDKYRKRKERQKDDQ